MKTPFSPHRALRRDITLAEHIAAIRQLGKQIGRYLSECKDLVGQRNFGCWLDKEFDWSERTAQLFMSVAGKSDNLSDLDLPVSAEPVRGEKIELKEVEETTRVETQQSLLIWLAHNHDLPSSVRAAACKELGWSLSTLQNQFTEGWVAAARYMIEEEKQRMRSEGRRGQVHKDAVEAIAQKLGTSAGALTRLWQRHRHG